MKPIQFKFANFHGYSDVEPFEIIKQISDKTLEIRENGCRTVEWRQFW